MIKALLFLLAIFCLKAYSSVYDQDNRVDYYQVQKSHIKETFKSIAAQFSERSLLEKKNYYKLVSLSLRSQNYCADFKFSNQPIAAKCSAFLIDHNKVMTSARCIKTQSDCNKNYWVFGYKKNARQHNNFIFKKENVYKCKSIIKRVNRSKPRNSWAILELDRDVLSASPLELVDEDYNYKDKSISMLGHPLGLPAKFTDNAKILNLYKYSAKSNLDAADANKGSPIFDNESMKVIGIYYKGGKEYTYQNKCKIPYKTTNSKSQDYFIKINKSYLHK